jgi:antitoxin (DNA-binding transcriptional repressor) of toxin-antitoxin stability system
MYHIVKASIRDLRYQFRKVEHLLQQGEEIQITRRRRVIARLIPEREGRTPEIPDYMARLKQIYKKPLRTAARE